MASASASASASSEFPITFDSIRANIYGVDV